MGITGISLFMIISLGNHVSTLYNWDGGTKPNWAPDETAPGRESTLKLEHLKKHGASPKVRAGMALDSDIIAALDGLVEDLAAFHLTRSEVAGVILRDFLDSNPDYRTGILELVARYRIGRP